MDVDPIQVLVANQHQLKQISKEFYRSSTMSFGYAHEIQSIENYIPPSEIKPLRESVNLSEK
jgi:DNA-binding transcriptional regulator YiaG